MKKKVLKNKTVFRKTHLSYLRLARNQSCTLKTLSEALSEKLLFVNFEMKLYFGKMQNKKQWNMPSDLDKTAAKSLVQITFKK